MSRYYDHECSLGIIWSIGNVHVEQWTILSQMYSDGSELLLGLLCSFHVTFVLRLVSKMQHNTDKQNTGQNIGTK